MLQDENSEKIAGEALEWRTDNKFREINFKIYRK